MNLYDLKYNDYFLSVKEGMSSMLKNADIADVTLAMEGKFFKAHQVILSMFSPYFKELFTVNPSKHPIFFMKDVQYQVMKAILTFMYEGAVQIAEEDFHDFLVTAQALQVKGLIPMSQACISEIQVNCASSTDTNKTKQLNDNIRPTIVEPAAMNLDAQPVMSKLKMLPCTALTTNSKHQVPREHHSKFNVNIAERIAEVNAQEEDPSQAAMDVEDADKLQYNNRYIHKFDDANVKDCIKENDDCGTNINLHEEDNNLSEHIEDKATESYATVAFMKNEKSSMIVVDGHAYYRHRIRSEGWLRWRCARCSNGRPGRTCRASLYTNPKNLIVFKNTHDHQPYGPPVGARVLCREVYKIVNSNE